MTLPALPGVVWVCGYATATPANDNGPPLPDLATCGGWSWRVSARGPDRILSKAGQSERSRDMARRVEDAFFYGSK